MKARPTSRGTAESLPWSPAAVNSGACTGGGHVRSFYGRPFTSGHFTRSRTPTGPANITSSSGRRVSAVIPRSARWPSNGSASFSVAGRTAIHMTKAVYQQALSARRPNQQPSAAAVELQWKKVAGFSKIVTAEKSRRSSDVCPPPRQSQCKKRKELRKHLFVTHHDWEKCLTAITAP